MMESIEQLRKEIDILESNNIDTHELERIADAIEREVEERYIERPVDADGMTVSPSDNMVVSDWGQFTVSSIELLASGEWLVYGKGKLGNAFAKLCHHYKPPTVEDVLEKFASERIKLFLRMPMAVSDEGIEEYLKVNDEACEKLIAEYAAKLQIKEEK